MARYINSITNHTLNTSSLEELSRELSQRLNINIKYGYFAEKRFSVLLNNDRDGLIVLGAHSTKTAEKTFTLTEDYYQKKQLFQKHGKSIFENPEYWRFDDIDPREVNEDEILIELRQVDSRNRRYSMDRPLENGYFESLSIYNNFYSDLINSFPGEWRELLYFFREIIPDSYNFYDLYKDVVQEYQRTREKMKILMLKMGGTETYHFDDEKCQTINYAYGPKMGMSWEKYRSEIIKNFAHQCLDYSEYLTDKRYREKFLSTGKDPLYIFDDYRDLVW